MTGSTTTEGSAGAAPTDWTMISLGEASVFSFENGLWTGKKMPFTKARVLRNTNFNNDGTLDYSDVATLDVESRLLPTKQLLPGDIVIERSGGGPKQPVGRVAYFNLPQAGFSFSNFTSRLRVIDKTEVDPAFVLYALLQFHKAGGTLQMQSNTTGIRNLNFEDYRRILIPHPRLAEQRAIASVLSKIQAAVETQDKIIIKLQELRATTMAFLFGGGFSGKNISRTQERIPSNWKLVELGELAQIGNGSTPKRTNPAYWDGGTIPWLTSGKVHEIIINESDEFVTGLAKEECHLPLVPAGSIVVAITGQGKTLGNAALVTFPTCVNQHLAFVKFESKAVIPEFALGYLQHQYQDLRRAGNAGGSTKGALTCAFLKTYPIPLPTISEQNQIANALGALRLGIARAEAKGKTLRILLSSAVDALMTGQIRVQN